MQRTILAALAAAILLMSAAPASGVTWGALTSSVVEEAFGAADVGVAFDGAEAGGEALVSGLYDGPRTAIEVAPEDPGSAAVSSVPDAAQAVESALAALHAVCGHFDQPDLLIFNGGDLEPSIHGATGIVADACRAAVDAAARLVPLVKGLEAVVVPFVEGKAEDVDDAVRAVYGVVLNLADGVAQLVEAVVQLLLDTIDPLRVEVEGGADAIEEAAEEIAGIIDGEINSLIADYCRLAPDTPQVC